MLGAPRTTVTLAAGMLHQAGLIRNHNPRVPIVFITASPVEEQSLGCVDCFIRKGDGPVLLLAKIKQLHAQV